MCRELAILRMTSSVEVCTEIPDQENHLISVHVHTSTASIIYSFLANFKNNLILPVYKHVYILVNPCSAIASSGCGCEDCEHNGADHVGTARILIESGANGAI